MGRNSPGTGSAGGEDGAGSASWVLLPLVWCLWLLSWLAPSLMLAPHLDAPPPWLGTETAPAALVAAAVFFLVAVWPFWPALASHVRGGDGISARWLGRSILELVILFALAVPFALVACSVGGRAFQAAPLAAACGAAAVLGLAVRVADAGFGPAAGRWLMLMATLVCLGPLLLTYAAGETTALDFPHLPDVSPMVSGARLALAGWPDQAWRTFTDLALWPTVAVILVLVASSELVRRRRGG